jgi:hypothetical protein
MSKPQTEHQSFSWSFGTTSEEEIMVEARLTHPSEQLNSEEQEPIFARLLQDFSDNRAINSKDAFVRTEINLPSKTELELTGGISYIDADQNVTKFEGSKQTVQFKYDPKEEGELRKVTITTIDKKGNKLQETLEQRDDGLLYQTKNGKTEVLSTSPMIMRTTDSGIEIMTRRLERFKERPSIEISGIKEDRNWMRARLRVEHSKENFAGDSDANIEADYKTITDEFGRQTKVTHIEEEKPTAAFDYQGDSLTDLKSAQVKSGQLVYKIFVKDGVVFQGSGDKAEALTKGSLKLSIGGVVTVVDEKGRAVVDFRANIGFTLAHKLQMFDAELGRKAIVEKPLSEHGEK